MARAQRLERPIIRHTILDGNMGSAATDDAAAPSSGLRKELKHAFSKVGLGKVDSDIMSKCK